MNIDAKQMVDGMATRVGIDQLAAEKAAGTIFSVLRHESGPQADAIFAKVPGAAQLATQYDVMATTSQGGGLLGNLVNAVGNRFGLDGEKTGALVNGFEQLENTGLSTQQIRQAGTVLLSQLQAAAGPSAVSTALASVPALKSHLGM